MAKKVVSPGAVLFTMKFFPGDRRLHLVSHQEKVNVPAIPEVGGGSSNDWCITTTQYCFQLSNYQPSKNDFGIVKFFFLRREIVTDGRSFGSRFIYLLSAIFKFTTKI